MTELQSDNIFESSSGQDKRIHTVNLEKKIAWMTAGMIAFGLWSVFYMGIFIYAFSQGVFNETPDAVGVVLTFLIFFFFVVLPGFASWKCFKASRRLTRDRLDKFIQKRAFE